jgi:hypothetical protein
MFVSRIAVIALAATAPLVSACGFGRAEPAGLAAVEERPAPAAEGSRFASLYTGPDSRVYMSWIESRGEAENALRFSVWDGAAWSPARTIHEGDDFWVNWADFPSIAAFEDGSLAAHWLSRSGPATFDYDVRITRSEDGGLTWTEPVTPHRDGTLAEHGFVSLFPWPEGGFGAVWLDGRDYAYVKESGESRRPEMTLRHTVFAADGRPGEDVLLDDRVCDCCQTSAALTSEGPIIVYRDRTEDEVRDISFIRHTAQGWTEPQPVHRDGWVIPACPVNGPQVAANGERVVVAWFTAAEDVPRVRAAFSRDAGASFDTPLEIDDGQPLGRVAVTLLPDGAALVSWLEQTDGGAEVRVRRVSPSGSQGPATRVAVTDPARSSGFPRMARLDDRMLFAWTDPDLAGAPQVRVATELIED